MSFWWYDADDSELLADEPDVDWYFDPEVGTGVDALMVAKIEEWRRQGLPVDYFDDDPPGEAVLDIVAEPPPPPPRCENCRVGEFAAADHPFYEYQRAARTYACCCLVCRSETRLPGSWPLCASCQLARLCKVCGTEWAIVKHRCGTCRKYFDRKGVERPRHLIKKRAESNSLAELNDAHRALVQRMESPDVE